jgi:hypothetical protein
MNGTMDHLPDELRDPALREGATALAKVLGVDPYPGVAGPVYIFTVDKLHEYCAHCHYSMMLALGRRGALK